jgi:hypothetical protein
VTRISSQRFPEQAISGFERSSDLRVCPVPVQTSRVVLAALNFGALALGVAAGGLAASVIGLALSGLLVLVGVEAGPDIGLVVGVLTGLAAGGWMAGLRSAHSHRFHGMITGLMLAFVIMAIARLGGSPAPTLTVIWLAVIAVIVSGVFGWLAGRRRARRSSRGAAS